MGSLAYAALLLLDLLAVPIDLKTLGAGLLMGLLLGCTSMCAYVWLFRRSNYGRVGGQESCGAGLSRMTCIVLIIGSLVLCLCTFLVAAALLIPRADCLTQCELVVAYCQEDLLWLPAQAALYKRTFVFSKCGAQLPPQVLNSSADLSVISIPNIGSCDYAYLQHVISHFDHLAPITVFCKGTHSWKCSPNLVMRPSPTLYPTSTKFDASHLTRLAYWGRYPPGLKGLRVSDHGFTFHSGRTHLHPFVRSGFRDYEEWLGYTFGRSLAAWLFDHAQWLQMGGFFVAERENFRRYPRILFESVAAQQHSANEEVDHFMERTWGMLLTTPHVPDTIIAASLATSCACIGVEPYHLSECVSERCGFGQQRRKNATRAGGKSPVKARRKKYEP